MADNIAVLGRITRTRRQVRLANGRCGGINAQLEVEVKFGNKQVTMSLLILPGVVDPLVLGWNFLKQVGAEIRCAGHEIIIPARNRHNGWLEEKLSVAVVQQVNELDYSTAFLEAELADFSTMTGTLNMAEHQIKMKDVKPIKQRYYPKKRYYPKNPGGNKRNGVHRAFKEPIQLTHRDGETDDRQVETVCRLQADQREVSEGCLPNARINFILDQLREARYISSLDLKDGYWQIPLEERRRQYTAFTVPGNGLFHSASVTFRRVLDQVTGPEMSPHAFAYQDKIIVISRTLEEHKRNLREVIRRLKEANLRLNLEKCQFLKKELLYLGHRVTSEGIGTDPEKVAAIAELEPPSTVKEFRQY